jgi:hypothetical protein
LAEYLPPAAIHTRWFDRDDDDSSCSMSCDEASSHDSRRVLPVTRPPSAWCREIRSGYVSPALLLTLFD